MTEHQLFWGDLHSHCSISYGHGTVEQAIARARQQLDFCSITGHAFWPDMPTDRERYAAIIDYHLEGFDRLAGRWSELLSLQAAGSSAGEFLALPSYEWHSLEYGDHNVYAAGPELALRDATTLPQLRNVLREQNQAAIAIPHHIGYRRGYRGINWDAFTDECSPFVEVYSLHGCSLSDDAAYPMFHDMGPRDAESLAVHGWRLGHRFGIVAGTDHHAAYPGSHGDGRMGTYATELTRDALWEAFLKRRVYAVTGDPIDARMFVDSAWIGETIRSRGIRRIAAQVRGLDAIKQIVVLRNERPIHRWLPESTIEHKGPFLVRMTWGWGRQQELANWSVVCRTQDGCVNRVTPCFSGQSIVAPDSGEVLLDTMDLPHEILEQSERHVAWRSITSGNRSMRHATTQSLVIEIDGSLDTRLDIEVNGQSLSYQLAELVNGARSHFMRGWLTEAFCVGPVRSRNEYSIDVEWTDQREREVDYYRMEVEQVNGQWAWLTPVWVES